MVHKTRLGFWQVSALAARVGSRKQVLAAEAMRADEVEGRLHARRTRFKCVSLEYTCIAMCHAQQIMHDSFICTACIQYAMCMTSSHLLRFCSES